MGKTTKNQAKKTLLIVAFFSLISLNTKSQNTFNLPKGYQINKDYTGKEKKVEADFDGDGVLDLAILCEDTNYKKIIVVYLASKWLVNQSYWWFPWDYPYNDLNYTNNVLTINSGDRDFFNIILKLKYNSSLNNMILIGYEQREDEHAADGTGGMVNVMSKSMDLDKGVYQINGGEKKKININTITLSNIEKYFDYLFQFGGEN